MAARVAIIGAGWAGLSAAVRAVQAGHRVVICEMSRQLGGRARALDDGDDALDNGQHILIGAYTRTLALMHDVGADAQTLLKRLPLNLRFPDGAGLALRGGAPSLSLLSGILQFDGLGVGEQLSLLRHAAGWAVRGFSCSASLTVDALCVGLAPRVRQLLIDPLCVAAMNTRAQQASARVFLRMLHDALLGGRGSADLLLPKRPLGDVLPRPAQRWLTTHGAELRLGARVVALCPSADAQPAGWTVDGEHFDGVVLACSAHEAARLTEAIAPAWSSHTAALRFEPIVTVYAQADGARLASPITALYEGDRAPAQFVFDLGQLGRKPGLFACVVSGAQRWVDAGLVDTGRAALQQLAAAFPAATWPKTPALMRTVAEKRATFLCIPGLLRPSASIAPGLVAAGDYTEGPYPATLEGAVRSGERAMNRLTSHLTR